MTIFQGLKLRISNYPELTRRLMAAQKKYNTSMKTNYNKVQLEQDNEAARRWFDQLGRI